MPDEEKQEEGQEGEEGRVVQLGATLEGTSQDGVAVEDEEDEDG